MRLRSKGIMLRLAHDVSQRWLQDFIFVYLKLHNKAELQIKYVRKQDCKAKILTLNCPLFLNTAVV